MLVLGIGLSMVRSKPDIVHNADGRMQWMVRRRTRFEVHTGEQLTGPHIDPIVPAAIVPAAIVPAAIVPAAIVPAAIVPAAIVPAAIVPAAIAGTTNHNRNGNVTT
jgi:hypothetical protein